MNTLSHPIKYSQLKKIDLLKVENIKTICTLAKEFKDALVYVTQDFMYSTNLEGYVYKRMWLGLPGTPTFAFSVNQLKTTSAKLVLENPDDVYMVGYIMTNTANIDIIRNKAYTMDALMNLVDPNGNIIPAIRTNSSDQLYEFFYLFNREYAKADRTMMYFDIAHESTNPPYVVEGFELNPSFIDMVGSKKELGIFRTVIDGPNKKYILSFFKNMIPFKKNDKVTLYILDDGPNSFSVKYVVHRAKHVPIEVYANYLDIARPY